MDYTHETYTHDSLPTTGILLVNLGTPDAPTPGALRRYLAEFLSDPRVTEMPRWFWWLILHGIILRTRPRRSALKYQKIWTEAGAPLLNISQAQAQALVQALRAHFAGPINVALGMRYGNPSIATGLEQLRQANARRILILPLYPQYSSTSTGSIFDAVGDVLKRWRWLPDLRFISHYHDQTAYIYALVVQIKNYWNQYGIPDKLLFSFHGIPKRFFLAGDPYHCECHKTARLVAEQLKLAQEKWQVVFQSRFGREEWLKPYTDHSLMTLGKGGVKRVDVICPGFAADCLETLEEINEENRKIFLQAGGKEFHYIPALNDNVEHIQALLELVIQHTQGWAT
ncbi:MAG: ferrochelatase [Gammaproteobacteria bacterium]|nr:MAG: ferrochelatase [Gammaproteobacteria bacterium]RKZ43351.1 MAG: ferrochelatase [Gammaproteobacteria bacterium]RKZ73421.1 MAG: ferrochelatase [Gammaproteobacteria bacterium]